MPIPGHTDVNKLNDARPVNTEVQTGQTGETRSLRFDDTHRTRRVTLIFCILRTVKMEPKEKKKKKGVIKNGCMDEEVGGTQVTPCHITALQL